MLREIIMVHGYDRANAFLEHLRPLLLSYSLSMVTSCVTFRRPFLLEKGPIIRSLSLGAGEVV